MPQSNVDTRPTAPAHYQQWDALQRGHFLHMFRDCFDVLQLLHTAPLFTDELVGAIRGYMLTSILSASTYAVPANFNQSTDAAAQPFRAVIAHIQDIASITINHSMDSESICGVIYTRTATLIKIIFPHLYQEWLGKQS